LPIIRYAKASKTAGRVGEIGATLQECLLDVVSRQAGQDRPDAERLKGILVGISHLVASFPRQAYPRALDAVGQLLDGRKPLPAEDLLPTVIEAYANLGAGSGVEGGPLAAILQDTNRSLATRQRAASSLGRLRDVKGIAALEKVAGDRAEMVILRAN